MEVPLGNTFATRDRSFVSGLGCCCVISKFTNGDCEPSRLYGVCCVLVICRWLILSSVAISAFNA
eukprot:3605949-Amphidinium_carterae.6